jgi:hypothetical protein
MITAVLPANNLLYISHQARATRIIDIVCKAFPKETVLFFGNTFVSVTTMFYVFPSLLFLVSYSESSDVRIFSEITATQFSSELKHSQIKRLSSF